MNAPGQESSKSPQSEQIFKTRTDLVVVNAQILDRKTHRAVHDLGQGDFLIYEDGVLQQITAFGSDMQPLSIVLLFQATESSRPMLKQLGLGAEATLRHLKESDEVALMAFSRSIGMVEYLTQDKKVMETAITRASQTVAAIREKASLIEGIYGAINYLSNASSSDNRRIVIALSNIPLDDQLQLIHTQKETLALMDGSGTVVCGVIRKSLFGQKPGVYTFAQQSGGKVVAVSGKNINSDLAQLFDDLRACYTLGYISSNPSRNGTFRTIEVRLKSRDALVLTPKKGYYAN